MESLVLLRKQIEFQKSGINFRFSLRCKLCRTVLIVSRNSQSLAIVSKLQKSCVCMTRCGNSCSKVVLQFTLNSRLKLFSEFSLLVCLAQVKCQKI